MGEITEGLISGEFDFYTGQYIGEPVGYPRWIVDKSSKKNRRKYYKSLTPSERKIASIRKEIALDIKSGTSVNEARKKANLKYGKGWRERGLVRNSENQWNEEDLKPFRE